MKNYKTIRKGFWAMFLVCIILCANTLGVFAHEIYYDGTTPVPLKWYDVTNRVANLKMNGDLLDSNYSPHYSVIREAWPAASPRVSITEATFQTSNIDLGTATSDYWDNRFEFPWNIYMAGICDLSSVNGNEINSLQTAKTSGGLIRYAGILFTPYFDLYQNATQVRSTMVHEIGHALGLGHPNTDYYVTDALSIMRQEVNTVYYMPQTHDISDLNMKYQ